MKFLRVKNYIINLEKLWLLEKTRIADYFIIIIYYDPDNHYHILFDSKDERDEYFNQITDVMNE